MNTLIRNTLAALVVATAGIAASAPTASAGDIGFSLSIGGAGSSMVVRDHGRRGDRGWNRFKGHRSACAPNRAVSKASRMGVRRAHVVRANHRSVVVQGMRHHRSVRVVFANNRGCPVINVRR